MGVSFLPTGRWPIGVRALDRGRSASASVAPGPGTLPVPGSLVADVSLAPGPQEASEEPTRRRRPSLPFLLPLLLLPLAPVVMFLPMLTGEPDERRDPGEVAMAEPVSRSESAPLQDGPKVVASLLLPGEGPAPSGVTVSDQVLVADGLDGAGSDGDRGGHRRPLGQRDPDGRSDRGRVGGGRSAAGGDRQRRAADRRDRHDSASGRGLRGERRAGRRDPDDRPEARGRRSRDPEGQRVAPRERSGPAVGSGRTPAADQVEPRARSTRADRGIGHARSETDRAGTRDGARSRARAKPNVREAGSDHRREGTVRPAGPAAGATTTDRKPQGTPEPAPAPASALTAVDEPGATPYPRIGLPDPGPCAGRHADAHLLLVLDDSGSTSQTDPRSRRYPEARQVLAWMARNACGGRERLSVVHFGASAIRTGPLDPASGGGRLKVALAGPDPGVGTDATRIHPAIDEVEAALQGADAARSLVVILSDGQVEDAASLHRLDRLRADVHVVALGASLPAFWGGVGLDGVLTLDGRTRPGVVGRHLARLWLGLTRPSACCATATRK